MDIATLNLALYEQLKEHFRLREVKAGLLAVETPFLFADGDHFQVYIKELTDNKLLITDSAHTLMQLSYTVEVGHLFDGVLAPRFQSVVSSAGLYETHGELCLATEPQDLFVNVLKFCQGVQAVYDLRFELQSMPHRV